MTLYKNTDDIVTMAETIENLSIMFDDLWGAPKQACLKMNMGIMQMMLKTQVPPTPLNIKKSLIEIFTIFYT